MPAPVHGGRRPRRGGNQIHEEESGSERWMVTYADMLTLLLVLFIVLFAMSSLDVTKFDALKHSLSSAFGSGTAGVLSDGTGIAEQSTSTSGLSIVMPGDPAVPVSTAKTGKTTASAGSSGAAGVDTAAAKAADELAKLKAIQKVIAHSLANKGMLSSVRFAISSRGLVITVITNKLIFGPNSATVLSEGQRILAVVAPPLSKQSRDIDVDGYTNQENVSTAPYPTGWELSSARASSVVEYLLAHGVTKSRLKASGYSDQHPLYPAGDPRAKTLNRRVEIVVLSSLLSTATPG